VRASAGAAFLLAAALCAAVPAPAAETDDPARREREAYTVMLRADGLRDDGRTDRARAAYEDARRLFSALRRDQPDHNANILSAREEYCLRERDRLQPPAPPVVETKPEPPPAPPPAQDVVPAADLEAARRERDVALERLAAAESRLAQVRDEMIRVREGAETAARALRDAESELRSARRQADEAAVAREKAEAKFAVRQEEIERLRAENRERAAGRTDAPAPAGEPDRVDAAKIAEDAAAQARRAWEGEKRALERERDDARAEVARRDRLAESLRAKLEAARMEAAAAAAAAASAPRPAAGPAPAAASALAREAADALAAGDAEGALRLYERIERDGDMDAAARFGLARAAAATGDFRRARRLARDLVKAEPAQAPYRRFLGALSLAEGRPDEAVEEMAAAVALAPDDPALRKELAAACYRANRLPEALAEFEAALKIAADDGRAHFNAAALLLATDPSRREEAARHYDEAIRLGERRDESFEKKLGR